jgi:T4 bacteriophage base plate protein
MNPNNPLRQYFRQPAIYIRLPSNGEYYPPGSIDVPDSREFAVYPMTAIDEITYRTPDALFNGEAIVSVIQSCIPAVKNAWAMPQLDLDAMLTAIRIASYGHEMEFTTKCPKCDHDEDRVLDLRTVMDLLRAPDYSKSLQTNDIEIYFKPMTYKNITDNNRSQYEEQRLLTQVPPEGADGDVEAIAAARALRYTEVLKRITAITIKAIGSSIALIKTPTATVTDLEDITEFLANCDRKLFGQIRDHVIEAKQSSELQPLKVTCTNCQFE